MIKTKSVFLIAAVFVLFFLFFYAWAQNEPVDLERQMPPKARGSGPWDNDVAVFRFDASGRPRKIFTFKGAGVPTVARMKDGRLIAAFQYFPENDERNFDRVAVSFSKDEGFNWGKPVPIVVKAMPYELMRPFDPTFVVLPDGRIRLYFTSNRARTFQESAPQIYSAISSDGINYIFEPGIRFGVEGRVVIDCAVALHNGVFHLIAPDNGAVSDLSFNGGMGDSRSGFGYHAISSDGLKFEPVADVVFSSDNNWLGNMQSDEGRLFFFGSGPGPWPASSIDASSWSLSNFPMLVPGADPGAVKLGDGSWLLLAIVRRDMNER